MIDKKKQQNTKLAVLSNFSDVFSWPKGDPKVVCHPGPCWSFEPQPTQPFMDGEFGSFELGFFDGFEPSTEIDVI